MVGKKSRGNDVGGGDTKTVISSFKSTQAALRVQRPCIKRGDNRTATEELGYGQPEPGKRNGLGARCLKSGKTIVEMENCTTAPRSLLSVHFCLGGGWVEQLCLGVCGFKTPKTKVCWGWV